MITALQLGTVDYSTALCLQQSLVELRKRGEISDVLLLLEHTPVITLGRNAKRQHVLASETRLAEAGVEVFECDRGGDVTYHGPGQLVVYPIFDLRGFQPSIGAVEFVRRLEEVLIRTCADFGIATERVDGMTGVWTKTDSTQRRGDAENTGEPAKIAAIGVHISRGVTSHGFALNVNTDLTYFDLVVPCGLAAKPVTSIAKELGRPVAMDEVAQAIAQRFGDVFECEVSWAKSLEALAGRDADVPLRLPEELRRLRGDDSTWA
ncbi:MAG: lipoyl(octanoyl) transferase LipB [Acidobacteria bacterium]|nr:lipoyl(octanoyl) transferase LipB [Acidobacteriota bacterium]